MEPRKAKSARISSLERAEVIRCIENHTAVALRGMESDQVDSTHLTIDGLFYLGFESEPFKEEVISLRSEVSSKMAEKQ